MRESVCQSAAYPVGSQMGQRAEPCWGGGGEEKKARAGGWREALRMLSSGRLPKFFSAACLAEPVSSRVNTADS